MIYITYKNSFMKTDEIKSVWDVESDDVVIEYKKFMHAKAVEKNITINPNWLNVMDYKLHNNHLTVTEYKKKKKEWEKELNTMNIDAFISKLPTSKKLEFKDLNLWC